MKNWHETSQVVRRFAELADAGQRAALATVLEIRGSAYRRPGAKLLVDDTGDTLGGVSGGCLEADVREVALEVLRDGVPRVRHYDTGGDELAPWGLGLGCDGAVDILVESLGQPGAPEITARLLELLEGSVPFALCTVLSSPHGAGQHLIVTPDRVVTGSTGATSLDTRLADVAARRLEDDATGIHEGDDARVFVEILVPPPRLLIFGAGDDAMPLVAGAAGAGFRVTVVDHRPAFLTHERFPDARELRETRAEGGVEGFELDHDSYAVVMTHSMERDRDWVRSLLATDTPYVGILGPRSRAERILADVDARDRARLFGPVGLDVGAEGPEQIAISILGEVLAVRAGNPSGHLREKKGAIHAG